MQDLSFTCIFKKDRPSLIFGIFESADASIAFENLSTINSPTMQQEKQIFFEMK
jgi:hypothetical protein